MWKEFFNKHETLFTILLIVIYVVVNSYMMQNFGYTSIQSTIFNTIMSILIIVLMVSIKRVKYYGLTRYSPLTRLSDTLTFLLCQKASLVSRILSLISRVSTYWNEYFPCSSTFWSLSAELSKNGYSAVSLQRSSVRPSDFQPNSGEWISQSERRMFLHSRTALIPQSVQRSITPFSAYQMAARVFSSIVQLHMEKSTVCHRG